MIDSEKVAFMQMWAAKNMCALQQKGEVGFGRPCVGIVWGGSYVDYSYEDDIWIPETAYHKHECLSVLVSDGDYASALENLYTWVKWLDENNWHVKIVARETFNPPGSPGAALELMLNGLKRPLLVREF